MPTNDDTNTIDYDVRFMITDNTVHPKTYRATKLMDTFPLGTIKVTLGQSHYNEHTDLCKKIELSDLGDTEETMHMICDYYKSSLPPLSPETNEDAFWLLESKIDKIRIEEEVQIKASTSNIGAKPCEWNIYIDGTEYTFADLSSYMEYEQIDSYDSETNTNNSVMSIKIKKEADVLIGYIIKLSIFDSSAIDYDYIEMEVVDG